MSLTEISGAEVQSKVATPAAFWARQEELAGAGFHVECVPNALVAGGMSPAMCAAMYSHDPRDGGNVDSYNVGDVVAGLVEQLGPPPPALKTAFDTNAGGYEASKQFDISFDVSGGFKHS